MNVYILAGATAYSKSQKLLGKFCSEILLSRFKTAALVRDTGALTYPCLLLRDDYPLISPESVSLAGQALALGKTYEKGGVFALYSPAQIFAVSRYPEGFSKSTFSKYCTRAKEEILLSLAAAGVTVYDPASVWVEYGVTVMAGAEIYPNNLLTGRTVIGKNSVLYPGNVLTDTLVGEGTSLTYTVANSVSIGNGCTVGPFSNLRKGTEIQDNCRVGNFVEIKNSLLHGGVKAAHLSYIGDAEIGEKTNVGCGVVFANYDGAKKHKTTVGSGCFLGCNANLISPLTVGDGVFVAAGTTVTESVSSDSFVIGRARQTVKKKKLR